MLCAGGATAGASVIGRSSWPLPLTIRPSSTTGFFSTWPFWSVGPSRSIGPSTTRGACGVGISASTFHHRGLASILQRTHLRSGLGAGGSADSSLTDMPAFDCRPRADVGVGAVTADALRLTGVGAIWGTMRVDWSTKLALRAVPVKVRSACLNSRANNCNAISSVPSTSSFMG